MQKRFRRITVCQLHQSSCVLILPRQVKPFQQLISKFAKGKRNPLGNFLISGKHFRAQHQYTPRCSFHYISFSCIGSINLCFLSLRRSFASRQNSIQWKTKTMKTKSLCTGKYYIQSKEKTGTKKCSLVKRLTLREFRYIVSPELICREFKMFPPRFRRIAATDFCFGWKFPQKFSVVPLALISNNTEEISSSLVLKYIYKNNTSVHFQHFSKGKRKPVEFDPMRTKGNFSFDG